LKYVEEVETGILVSKPDHDTLFSGVNGPVADAPASTRHRCTCVAPFQLT
jgi:hypothetical protein